MHALVEESETVKKREEKISNVRTLLMDNNLRSFLGMKRIDKRPKH